MVNNEEKMDFFDQWKMLLAYFLPQKIQVKCPNIFQNKF